MPQPSTEEIRTAVQENAEFFFGQQESDRPATRSHVNVCRAFILNDLGLDYTQVDAQVQEQIDEYLEQELDARDIMLSGVLL